MRRCISAIKVPSAALLAVCTVMSYVSGADVAPAKAISLGHVVVWTEDLEATSRFLTDIVGWRRHPMKFGISSSDRTTGGMDLAFIDANGMWIKLVSPTSPGNATDVLRSKGNGALGEIVVLTPDLDELARDMKRKDIALENMDGTPWKNGQGVRLEIQRSGVRQSVGARVGYFPLASTRGTSVAAIEHRVEDPTNVLSERDRTWSRDSTHSAVPRLDRIAIIVRDIEFSARFYTEVLGFKRHPLEFGLDSTTNAESGGMKGAFIDTGGVWIALIQPVGEGPLMDYLERKGDGHIAELIAEVDDLGAYYDAMKLRGIALVDTRGRPLDESKKAHVLEPYGDRIAYFPAEVSQGLTIEVFQRGPTAASLLRQRDAVRLQ